MNIAFPALFVFLLALPGIILRYAYREWGWKTPVHRLPVSEEVAKSIFGAALLNLAWCWMAERFGYRINLNDVLILLTGGFGLPPNVLAHRFPAITKHPVAIVSYFISLYIFAGMAGLTGRSLVRIFRLDLRFKLLRFDNFWHYALNAEFPLFAENRDAYAEMLGISETELENQEALVVVSGWSHTTRVALFTLVCRSTTSSTAQAS